MLHGQGRNRGFMDKAIHVLAAYLLGKKDAKFMKQNLFSCCLIPAAHVVAKISRKHDFDGHPISSLGAASTTVLSLIPCTASGLFLAELLQEANAAWRYLGVQGRLRQG